jgi:catalase
MKTTSHDHIPRGFVSEIGNGGETQQLAQGDAAVLTTNHGAAVRDNQNSSRAYDRGPALVDDQVFINKIGHFDRERIPERVVHAHGSAAHGYFELTASLDHYTVAKVLTEVGKQTPCFARLSTVAGSAGSADTVRDVRGFAVKFYTDEGNWDLVGNNIPVFFIQDAMKFPDLVHAVKREPDRGFPSASSAHDTFWDFISLMPESMHMIMWIMSDRTIPRSLRMMEGFGVHTFRLINAEGKATFVKFHWRPTLGTQSLVWDEAVKIAGADSDYHRRDLWNAIDTGHYPEWALAVQLLSEDEAADLPFDILDATKLLPEELYPLKVIGKMVLDRNPVNFFSENEQVAFSPNRLVPGIDTSNDPLLQGRILSYEDTQHYRLGGSNHHLLPINRPRCPFQNYSRDGLSQHQLPIGRVAYEPNSLAPDSPRATVEKGLLLHPEIPGSGQRGRYRSASFNDHYSQARMFFLSQLPIEQNHMVSALIFELSKVETTTIRERMVSHLLVIDERLGSRVAAGLALNPLPDAAVASSTLTDYDPSPATRILGKYPNSLKGRCVGVLIDEGSSAEDLETLLHRLEGQQAQVKLIAPKIYGITLSNGRHQTVHAQLAGSPAVLYDAVAIILSESSAEKISAESAAIDFARDAYSHLKAIYVDSGGLTLLACAGVIPDDFVVDVNTPETFLDRAASRCWDREALVRTPV